MPPYFIMAAPFSSQYAYSFFWSVSVVTGTGWDIIPATDTEVAFSSIMIFIGTATYVTILSSVTSIVTNLGSAKNKRMEKFERILRHLRKTKAPPLLIARTRGYYDFLWADDEKMSDSFFDEVQGLPPSLQASLFQQFHDAYLDRVPILRMLSPKAIFALARKWQHEM